ncbi:SUKH-4 family immunity protein [Streptomyces sp. SLBN-31]|uniref:SUKH-4 family immunity protein n=1 Tax=Streptomyces sp. SLBN-31 TaxID=2768444 RepID=UPI0011531E49|nr:SUKH-4 family immunity protein [Streptomyces sp. SLBN-31]
MSNDLDGVLADPARLLSVDRAVVRAHLDGSDRARSVGGEVFLQAEAIFGGGEVTSDEFASWLHFAAKATGQHNYADRVAAAAPGMPWRTTWAWWRPANWFPAHPSLNGDYFQVRRCLDGQRELIEVTDQRGPIWLEAATGRRVTVMDEMALTGVPAAAGPGTADALCDLDLSLPEEWGGAEAFATDGGRTRHLIESVHGIAVVETDRDTLRDWPRDAGLDSTSAEEPPPGPAPAVRRSTGPLTAARIDDAFGKQHVVRIPEGELPEGLAHEGVRRFLRDVGLPSWWACHSAQYETRPVDAMRPPVPEDLAGTGLPDGMATEDLIAFGDTEYGELYLHRHDGTVHIRSRLTGPHDTLVPLAPDLDVFTRVLEAIDRYRNACWHPYPAEGGQEDVSQLFLAELAELAPDLPDQDTPTGTVWSWLYAGITELGVDGY